MELTWSDPDRVGVLKQELWASLSICGNLGVRSLEQCVSHTVCPPHYTFIDCVFFNEEVLITHLLFIYTVVNIKMRKEGLLNVLYVALCGVSSTFYYELFNKSEHCFKKLIAVQIILIHWNANCLMQLIFVLLINFVSISK